MVIQTVASVLPFVLLMALYPDVQKRAQDEIDLVVGKDRLPSIEDQDKLVSTGALIKGVIRLAPVAPLGVCHSKVIFRRADLALVQIFLIGRWKKTHAWDTMINLGFEYLACDRLSSPRRGS